MGREVGRDGSVIRLGNGLRERVRESNHYIVAVSFGIKDKMGLER